MRPLAIRVSPTVAEGLAAVVLLAITGVAGARAVQAYDEYVRPLARSVPTATPTPVVDPQAVRENARRMRIAIDHVGAGIALRKADPGAAAAEFMKALEIDPGNTEARQNLNEMGIQPPR